MRKNLIILLINQLDTIFKLSKDIRRQYIVLILRERVSSIDQRLIEEAKTIELSENDIFLEYKEAFALMSKDFLLTSFFYNTTVEASNRPHIYISGVRTILG